MEDKWIAIFMIGIVITMFSPLLISSYNANECKIAAINKGMSTDDILKLCKGPT
jgi:hypothetical protein